MDENRLKKIILKMLEVSFEGVTISEFRTLPTQKIDENGDWVHDSYTLFIGLKQSSDFYVNKTKVLEVDKFLESGLGFEVVVDFY